MDGGDVSVEGEVTCASWIKRPENAHLAVIGKSTGTCSSLEIFSFNSENTSLSSSPKATYVFEEGGEPVRIAVHPSGDDFMCSTTTGCKLFELYGHEDNIKFVCKEFPIQDVGPQKCMAFSVDGSKFATGGVDGHFRLFEWPTMRIIVDEPKAHKSFKDMDFSLDSEFLASTSTDGAARIWNTRDGVPVTLSRNADENIELCRFSKDGTKPFLFTTVQKGNKTLIVVWDISTWKKIGHKSLYNKPASIMTISLDGKYLALGSKDGDVCVIDVTKMEISSLHKRLHLGTNITSLEFCPSESVGLLASHFSYVKNIDTGLSLILFNYNNQKLYGIYEAASSGKMKINPCGCTLDGSGRTEFPAQVQIRSLLHCKPLAGTLFKPIIQDNYSNDQHHLMFELDHVQAPNLISKVALTTSSQWGVMVTKLNVPTDWKEWQIYLLLLGLFLASAILFYVFFENSDSFWNFPDPSARPKIETLHVDATSEEQWSSFGPVDL